MFIIDTWTKHYHNADMPHLLYSVSQKISLPFLKKGGLPSAVFYSFVSS